jgi:hypothetical protein
VADNNNVVYAEYHAALEEEEVIRTGTFLPTDSQKELAFADAESLMSPPAHIQTQREDGCSSRASSSLTVVSRQHLGSRFSQGTLERARRHLQEVGANKTQTLNKNS